ncbi:MAG: glutathione S-transferase family protein [Pseudomonadota bacterium]
MIVLHHLRIGRSIFTVWLLEEFGLEYDLKVYHRGADGRSQDDIKAATPLGKSPTIEIDGHVLTESGAIAAYLAEHHDTGFALSPAKSDWTAYADYLRWLHYPEGSAFAPLLIKLILMREDPRPPVLSAFSDGEVALHLGLLEKELSARPYILGERFQIPDIGISYIVSMAERLGELGPFPTLKAYWERNQSRDAWKRAVARAEE